MFSSRFRKALVACGKGDLAAVSTLVLVFFGANWRVLTNQASEQWDGEIFFAPFYDYVATLARHGHLLRWNPFSGGGSPDFAEPQIGAFSPVTLLFGLVAGPGPLGFHLYWLGVWLLGGLGMYVLARTLSAPPWGALIIALSVVLSGFYIGHAEHLSVGYTFSFIPWVLWRVRAAMLSGRRRPACEAGALWGLAALAGNPAVHVPAAMFIGIVALAWMPRIEPPAGSPWPRWRTYLWTMFLLAGVGVLVLAPAYLSFRYEVAGYSHRALPLPRGVVLNLKFGWSWLTALATPYLVSLDDTMPGWVEFDISNRQVYFGAVVPVLAIFAVWRQRSCRWTWVIFGTGLLCLGTALGRTLPLRAWLYDLLPFTRYFRHASLFRCFFILAMAMLAAPGTAFVDRCCRSAATHGRDLRALALAAGGTALLAVGSCVALGFALTTELWAQLSLVALCHLGFAWVGLAALCAAAARWPQVCRFLPVALAALAILDLTAAYAMINRVAYRNGPSFVADGPAQPLTDLGTSGFSRDRSDVFNANANLYSHRPVFGCYSAMRNSLADHWATDQQLVPYVLGPQRVYFAPEVPTVPGTFEAYEVFEERAHSTQSLPMVRQTRSSLLEAGPEPLTAEDRAAIASAPAAQLVDCRVLAYHDNDLALQVTCPKDGFLLVTDRWSRSWQATVNGKSVPVDGGDFLFRLVPVQAGSNLVEMRFHVPWLYALVFISWSVLAVTGIVSWRAWWQRRQPKEIRSTGHGGFRPVQEGIVLHAGV